jgi:hypothetical protein
MADLYRINESLLGEQLLPPDKRQPIFESYLDCLLVPAQYLNNLNNMWREGSLPPLWVATSPATPYNIGDLVLGWFNFSRSIFLSLTNSNTYPLGDTTHWLLIVDDFIGLNERLLYNGNKMVLEWGLNKYFSTVFRQPPGTSDIYIRDSDVNYSTFYISNDFYIAGNMLSDSSRGYITNVTIPISSAALSNNFTIYFPNSLYVTLPGYSGAGTVDTYITNFANQYVTAGLKYNIVTY